MNRTKLLRFSIRLANSLSSTHQSQLARLSSTQVTRSFLINPNFSPKLPCISSKNQFNFDRNRFFSSKTQSFNEIILSNEWSPETEYELDELNPNLTHESVLYVLMNLITSPRKSLDFFNWVCVKKGFNPGFSGYFVLLRTLACKEYMDEFWKVFLEIKKKGFYMDFKGYSTINVTLTRNELSKESAEWTKLYREMIENDVENEAVDAVLELISSSDWGEEVKGRLSDKLEFPLSENFVVRVIAKLCEEPLKALRFFEWIGSCGGYEHDSVTYNAMAQVLGCDDSVSEFWEFVKRMRVDGCELDMFTYVRCSRHLPIGDAVKLFEVMMDGPYQPSLQHSTMLMGRVSRELESEAHLDLVNRIFDKLVGAGVSPTKGLYDGVHSALCKLGRFDEAKNVFEELRKVGYKPDNFTYSQLISGLCKHGKLDEALKVIDQMEVEGCVPDAKTWTALIQGHCLADRMGLAVSCFAKMKEKNVDYGPVTLEVLIKGFIANNMLLDGYTYLTEFVNNESQIKPSQNTYKLMIEKLAEARNLKAVLVLLSMMKQHQYRIFPDPITQSISQYGTVGDAKRLLMVISPNNNSVCFRKVIEAFLEHGRCSEAKDLLLSSPPNVRNNETILAMFDSRKAPLVEEAPKQASS